MATGEFVFAANPEALKKRVRINRAKYDIMHVAILKNLRLYGAMTFTELGGLLEEQLSRDFDASVMWYFTTVKLDMETCGEIYRVPNSKPRLIALHEET